MGDWCGARSRRHGNENTDASEMANRGWSVPTRTQGKKRQKLGKGKVLPLDRSLLMGDFSVSLSGVPSRQGNPYEDYESV